MNGFRLRIRTQLFNMVKHYVILTSQMYSRFIHNTQLRRRREISFAGVYNAFEVPSITKKERKRNGVNGSRYYNFRR